MSELWPDGSNKWLNQPTSSDSVTTTTTTNRIFANLSACNVATSTEKISMKLQIGGVILLHVALSDVVGVILEGERIILDCSDEIDYTLVFGSTSDAEQAEDRIYRMLNGENVAIC
jgi:hypothetical protein